MPVDKMYETFWRSLVPPWSGSLQAKDLFLTK